MQPSKTSIYVKRTIKAILFIAIFFIINLFLCTVFEFKETESEKMLSRYSKQEGIDTVILGNSVAKMIDDSELSSLVGCRAFNMCTPDQSYALSLKALRLADSQNDIKRVVLVTTYDAGVNENHKIVGEIFERTFDRGFAFGKKIKRFIFRKISASLDADTIGTEESINLWMPWISENNHSLADEKDNLEYRFDRFKKGYKFRDDLSRDLDTVIHERKPGNLLEDDLRLLDNDLKEMQGLSIPEGMLSERSIRELAGLATYCRDNGIRLSVVISPHRTDYYERYEGYLDYCNIVDKYLSDFISKRGFIYYNFEYDSEIHQKLPDSYFYDWEHISDEYHKESTAVWADELKRLYGLTK